jgi:hypothetical protein
LRARIPFRVICKNGRNSRRIPKQGADLDKITDAESYI